MTSQVLQPMAWTNEKIRLACVDNIGLRQLWKLIALDNNSTTTTATTNKNNKIVVDSENLQEFLSNRDLLLPNKMSLLKFLAINALELSAPAAPVLLQQQNNYNNNNNNNVNNNSINNTKPNGWVQLSGHPESIIPTTSGIVNKRVTGKTDCELLAYQEINKDQLATKIVPKFLGFKQINDDTSYIELQDLLSDFHEPNVMDIKMGCRTFLETEVTNTTLRKDLYNKMCSVDSTAPTAEEHEQKAITKLRYMLFRENMSSSQTKGFRIEAMKTCKTEPINDLKTIRTTNQIEATIASFLNNNNKITKELIKRLKFIRDTIEKSEFFQTHEIIGSSIFIVYDSQKCGVWLIDFAKSRKLPNHIKIDHRKQWVPGNCEEGLLHGIDELIKVFEAVYNLQKTTKLDLRKCNRR